MRATSCCTTGKGGLCPKLNPTLHHTTKPPSYTLPCGPPCSLPCPPNPIRFQLAYAHGDSDATMFPVLFRFQLVYAHGDSEALPAISERAITMQALLHLVSELVDSASASLHRGKSGVWDIKDTRWEGLGCGRGSEHWRQGLRQTMALRGYDCRRPGSFCGLRLLPGEALGKAAPKLAKALARALMDRPPYELMWLQGLGEDEQVSAFVHPHLGEYEQVSVSVHPH